MTVNTSGEHRLRFATPNEGDIAGVIAEKLQRFRTMDRVMRKSDLAEHDGPPQILDRPEAGPQFRGCSSGRTRFDRSVSDSWLCEFLDFEGWIKRRRGCT